MKKNQSSKRKLPNTWKKRDTFWAIMASICILIFVIHYSTLFVLASSSRSPLPLTNFTAPRYLTSEEITFFNQMIQDKPSMFGNHTVDLTSDGIYCFNVQLDSKFVNNRQWATVMGYVFYRPYSYSVGSLSYDSFDLFSSSTIELYFAGFEKWEFWQTAPGLSSSYNGWYGAYGSQGGSVTISLFGLGNDVTIADPYHTNTYKPGYPVYWSTALFNGTSSVPILNQPLLSYGQPGFVVQEGHAEEPDFNNNDKITTDGHAQQPNTPTFPTFIPPTIDTSTLETLLESLIDFVGEFADFVGECFSVFFSWLVEVIQNVGQSIYNAIVETAQFLYNNFVSLFEPMMVNVGHAVEPVQEDELIQAFEDTGIYQDFSSMTDLVNDSFDVFEDIEEPQTFRIPIHLENVTMLNCSTQYIDLGWFDSCKTALRAFMWCVTTFGLLYTIIDALPSYISGGDE